MGAKSVMIIDLSDYRLNIARECGIDYCVNSSTQNIATVVKREFGTRDKADLILECVGINITIDQSIEVARKGTDIILVGVFGDNLL